MALDNTEICEWMAFDLTKDEEWTEKYKKELELERQKGLSGRERLELLKKLLGGTDGNNSKPTS